MLRIIKSIPASRLLNTRKELISTATSLFNPIRSVHQITSTCIIYRAYKSNRKAAPSKPRRDPRRDRPISNEVTEYTAPNNKVIDSRLLPAAKNPSLMTEAELTKAKHDKTPLTPAQEAKSEIDARRFVQLLLKPIETPVFKRETKLITTELNEFFEIYPRNEKTYNTFIRGLAAMGEYKKAKEALVDMRTRGMAPDIMVYTSLMTGCVATKDADEAFKIFETILKDGLKPTDYTFSVLANVCVKSGQLNRAYSIVEMAKKYEVTVGNVLYSALIQGCLLEGQVDRAWQTWDHMRTWTGLVPDEVQYTLMINACTAREEAERALMLYEEMNHLQMQPTEVTYNSLLQCLSTRKDYYKDAFDVLEMMKDAGFAPDLYTLTLLLKTAARGGDDKTAELIFDQIMILPGIQAEKQELAYAWLMHSYSVAHRVDMQKSKENIEKGVKIYEKMLTSGIKPTNFTVNQYLSLFTEGLRVHRASDLIKTEFAKHGLVPDDYAYNSMIKMFARVRKPERAFDMFNLMKAEKLEPNKATYVFLVEACMKAQMYTSGINFLKELKEKGFPLHWSEEFVLAFKSSCGKLRQVAKEIDQITGRDQRWVPSYRKPGTRQFQKADRRELTDEDKKQLREQGRVSHLWKDPLPNKI